MKKDISANRRSFTGVMAFIFIGMILMSFQDTPYVNQILDTQEKTDTVPEKNSGNSINMKDFDKLRNTVDQSMIDARLELNKVNMDEVRKQVELSLEKLDIEKIMHEVESSLGNLDMSRLMADVKLSLKDIDWKNKDGDLKKAMDEASFEMDQIKNEINNISSEEIKKELKKVKLELAEIRDNLHEIDIDKIMLQAKEGMHAAKLELNQLKEMFLEMEKDGLVKLKDGFSIEFKNKDLYINNIKQPQSVSAKYHKYINENNFKIRIEKE